MKKVYEITFQYRMNFTYKKEDVIRLLSKLNAFGQTKRHLQNWCFMSKQKC